MPAYRLITHPTAFARLQAYRADLVTQGLQTAGHYLQSVLRGQALEPMTEALFLEQLLATKRPLIFAESNVYGDGRDWTLTELAILGDLGVAVPVTVFDDGRHQAPVRHATPFPATLLFIPGALLHNENGLPPADWAAVTRDGQIDPPAYQALYARRLLPLFLFANAQAEAAGQKALITLPGLGCGQFAGPFRGRLGEHLKTALITMLKQHAGRLPRIRAVYYDPYQECRNERFEFEGVSLRVRPLTQGNPGRPQLCEPVCYAEAEDDFTDCQLFSIVAWDHVSWPGNDFYGGGRHTDDGVKAAATSAMLALTGVEGHYDTRRYAYLPPAPYPTWGAVVKDRQLRLGGGDQLCLLG